MKAYQCSKCVHLYDLDETVTCNVGIDPRPKFREKEDAEICKKHYEELEVCKQWHKKFHWEM